MLLQWSGPLIVPADAPPDLAVAPNFERFDGIDNPELSHPAGLAGNEPAAGGYDYWHAPGTTPRPGQLDQPIGQVYTPGVLQGLMNTLGGQPLPVATAIKRAPGGYTPSKTPSIQHHLGVGQRATGWAQTVRLGEITSNPPEPGDLQSIIAGFG